jgi:hypothetical protein
MSSRLPWLRFEAVQGRKVFPSILCEDCGRLPTQHRCLVKVSKEGYLFEGAVVCGFAICSPCSSKYGEEGIFHCNLHKAVSLPASSAVRASKFQETDPADSLSLQRLATGSRCSSKSSSLDVENNNKKKKPAGEQQGAENLNSIDVEDNNNKKKSTRERGAEYSATEILLLSKAWISASENTLVGVNQKISTFWESVLQAYNTFKVQHEDYMQRQREKEKFTMRNFRRSVGGNDSDSDSDEDEDVYQLPARNLNSLQQKWSKKYNH